MSVEYKWRCQVVWLFACLSIWATGAHATSHAQQDTAGVLTDDSPVLLNFPTEIEIKALIDYVSQRLGIKILYDEETASKRINIKASGEIPASSLLGVLESALKMKGLALVDADAPGWKRVVTSEDLVSVAPAGEAQEAIEKFGRGTAVTQTFVLKHANLQDVDQLIKPFLTQPGANSMVLQESRTLIVTDYATNLLKIAKLIEVVDQPRPDVVMEFVPVRNIDASSLAGQVTQAWSAKSRVEGGAQPASVLEVIHDERTNQLLLVGQREDIDQAKMLIESFDTPLGVTTRAYVFVNVSAERIDRLIKQYVDPTGLQHNYRSTVDAEENVLIATATAEIHQRIEQMRRSKDVAAGHAQSPIRFYKVMNLPVTELLETIRAIEQRSGVADPVQRRRPLPTDGRIRPARPYAVPGANRLPRAVGDVELPTPPAYREPDRDRAPTPSPSAEPELSSDGGLRNAAGVLGQARVTADVHTNTLIIVAEPAVQRIYAELIKQLDRRRPQVLIEFKLVIIDTSDDFSLGVEISGGDRKGQDRLFGFSSFGLSEVNPVTGALQIIPGLGFNGTLVDPETADAVVRALTSHDRARVISSPRVMVNDNATGQLSSVSEEPFTSVNASQTVSTTSFAGFAEAGTTITVTPRIGEKDHLQLDFMITLNSFTGTGSEGVPPPRQTDEVTSQVTIPDGHTVIVGGLNRRNSTYELTSLPFVDRIPLARNVFGLETKGESHISMFVFIRPVILRDDKFKDLKFLSQRDTPKADVRPQYPLSEPVWIP